MLRLLSLCAAVSILLVSCGKEPAGLVDAVKEIPLAGGRDTMYIERSSFWDAGQDIARADSNRQTITFKLTPGDVEFITLRNMGGVPLKRDTIRSVVREPAEIFLRTGTRDTNMRLTVESADTRKPETNVVVFIRNRDSVYREFLFYSR